MARLRLAAIAAVLTACGGTPMKISNLRAEEIAATRAVVRFDTNLATSCEVRFGLSATALDSTATDPSMQPGAVSTVHQVPLEGLTPATTYFFRAHVQNADSEVSTFSTLGAQGTNLPNVALASAGTTIAAVSSNYGGLDAHSTYGAYNAIDGNLATEWSSNSDGNGAWIDLDLGQPRQLSQVGFRSRSMLDGSSIIQSFRVRFDGTSVQGPFDTPDPTVDYRFPLAPVTAQRVRFEAVTSTGGNTGAREVELY